MIVMTKSPAITSSSTLTILGVSTRRTTPVVIDRVCVVFVLFRSVTTTLPFAMANKRKWRFEMLCAGSTTEPPLATRPNISSEPVQGTERVQEGSLCLRTSTTASITPLTVSYTHLTLPTSDLV